MIQVSVKLGFLTLVQKVFDLCSFQEPGVPNIQCPLLAGKQTLNMTVSIPTSVPKYIY